MDVITLPRGIGIGIGIREGIRVGMVEVGTLFTRLMIAPFPTNRSTQSTNPLAAA